MPFPFLELPVLWIALDCIQREMRFTSTDNLEQDRLLSYVDELREFSQTYQLSFGKPEDLQSLCDRLANDEPFLLDFRAMIKSIVYRENCRLTEFNLVELVCITWADQANHDLNGSLGISKCDLAAVLRQTMKFPRIEPTESESDGSVPSSENHPDSEVISPILFSSNGKSTLTPEIEDQELVDTEYDPVAEVSASAIRADPWWAESNLPRTVVQSAWDQGPLLHREKNAGEANASHANPWLENSAFHKELLEFDRRRHSTHELLGEAVLADVAGGAKRSAFGLRP